MTTTDLLRSIGTEINMRVSHTGQYVILFNLYIKHRPDIHLLLYCGCRIENDILTVIGKYCFNIDLKNPNSLNQLSQLMIEEFLILCEDEGQKSRIIHNEYKN